MSTVKASRQVHTVCVEWVEEGAQSASIPTPDKKRCESYRNCSCEVM